MTIEQNLDEGNEDKEERKILGGPESFHDMVEKRLEEWRNYDECITIYHPGEARTETEKHADFIHLMDQMSRLSSYDHSQLKASYMFDKKQLNPYSINI